MDNTVSSCAAFFERIWPSEGKYVIACLVPTNNGRKVWKHKVLDTPAQAATFAIAMDRRGLTVYHACNSFKGWTPDKRIRTQNNVDACGCFYEDIDIGKPGCYATREQAIAGLKLFLAHTQFPQPLIVSSGRGLHIYWLLSENIDAEDWHRVARKKRLVSQHLGFLSDPAADCDAARVLRPPGTTWRKDGEARPVRWMLDGKMVDLDELEGKLDAYIALHGLVAPEQPMSVPQYLGVLSTLGPMSAPPSTPAFAARIVTQCKQMQHFAETGGEDEPSWYAGLGVLAFCEDGRQYAHEWGSRYPGYSEYETERKLAQREATGMGPTTCEFFRENWPERCAGCPHSCTTPVHLGREAPLPVAPQVPVTPVQGQPVQWQAPPCWPSGYGYDTQNEVIWTVEKDENGVNHRRNVASPLFYPLHQIRTESGEYAFRIRMHVREGVTREFDLPTKCVGDVRSLRVALSAQQIHVINDKRTLAFMADYMTEQRRKLDEINTYRQFGWHHDGTAFLVNDTLISADTTRQVLTSATIPEILRQPWECSGSAEEWAEGVNMLYNVPGCEHYQYVFAAAFGAILNPLLGVDEWRGIPLALTSDNAENSGYGKTTTAKIALNIYTRSSLSTVADATAKVIPTRCSAMNNMPFLIDEATSSIDASGMCDVIYALSNGRPRIGNDVTGRERVSVPPWNNSPIMTGNRGVFFLLQNARATPEAAQMRVFEVDMPMYPKLPALDSESPDYTELHSEHEQIAQHLLNKCYGTVGKQWIQFVIKNRQEITEKLRAVSRMLPRLVRGDNAKERFYCHHITCSLVGAYYAKKLGFLKFNLNAVRDWAIHHVRIMRMMARDSQDTVMDRLADLLASVMGKVLVTRRFDSLDVRKGITEIPLSIVRPAAPIVARLVTGGRHGDEERPKFFITVTAFNAWCKQEGIQPRTFRAELLKEGIIRTSAAESKENAYIVRVALGRGVEGLSLGNPQCIELDYEVVTGLAPEYLHLESQADNIVKFREAVVRSRGTTMEEQDTSEDIPQTGETS